MPSSIPKPLYNRTALKPSIVHIGMGAFHRAHQAYYLDALLGKDLTDWAICGMGIREADRRISTVMKEQDCLYSLVEKHPDSSMQTRIIGSITDFIFVPENPVAAIERLADPQTKIVSLTITEGGYNFDQNGEFILDNPEVQWDLQHPYAPKTVFGLLATALKIRMQKNIPAFTVLSCDNIQHNGDVVKKMLLRFASASDTAFTEWIRTNVGFPNCMVDRITPVTVQQDIEFLQNEYGLEDAWPVTSEPFIQWVLEDNFPNGRPAWEEVGVQFVKDIEPYEKMKLRLLNAGHSLLGMTGMLYGHSTVDEAVNDPELRCLLRQFMDKEVTPILGPIENIDLSRYKDTLIERFSNPHIKDQLNRICTDGSARLPKFLIPTLREQLSKGGSIARATLVLAAWCHVMENYENEPAKYKFPDPILEQLIREAKLSAGDDELRFVKIKSVFGNLAENERFVSFYLESIRNIRQKGIRQSVQMLTKQKEIA